MPSRARAASRRMRTHAECSRALRALPTSQAPHPPAAAAAAAWLVPLRGAHPAAAAQAQTAVRYRPPADSFFRHQDPVARIAALPGLLALDIAPRAPWPALDELDPFACNLVITALCAASSADTAAALGDEIRHCDVEALAAARERRARRIRLLSAHASCSKRRWHCSPRPGRRTTAA